MSARKNIFITADSNYRQQFDSDRTYERALARVAVSRGYATLTQLIGLLASDLPDELLHAGRDSIDNPHEKA
jgi:hypothetical protein